MNLNVFQFILILVIVFCVLEICYRVFIVKTDDVIRNEVENTRPPLPPLSFETYSSVVNLINNIYDDMEAVNECNVLIEQCAEVVPNVDQYCDTKSDKHIRFWRITYMTRIETNFSCLRIIGIITEWLMQFRLVQNLIESYQKFHSLLKKIENKVLKRHMI